MENNTLGLIFNFCGTFVLILVTLFGCWHQKIHTNKWTKKYWWQGWRPIFWVRPPEENARLMIKPRHKVVRCGAIPPKTQWILFGLFLLLIGFWLQIRG